MLIEILETVRSMERRLPPIAALSLRIGGRENKEAILERQLVPILGHGGGETIRTLQEMSDGDLQKRFDYLNGGTRRQVSYSEIVRLFRPPQQHATTVERNDDPSESEASPSGSSG